MLHFYNQQSLQYFTIQEDACVNSGTISRYSMALFVIVARIALQFVLNNFLL